MLFVLNLNLNLSIITTKVTGEQYLTSRAKYFQVLKQKKTMKLDCKTTEVHYLNRRLLKKKSLYQFMTRQMIKQ